MDEDRVREIVAEMIGDAAPAVHQTVIAMPDGRRVEMPVGEAMHYQLPEILAWCNARVPIWLWGAPGAGKTHMGRQVAAIMGLMPYVMSIDETTTANKLLGFQNLVSGAFVPGWLYQPYKDGGLAILDEIDTGNPGIIAGLNALLANSHYLFPNGETVERHADFQVIACANTKGTGAVAGYTARQRLDAATLDRFAVLQLQYDDGLEMQIACGVRSETSPWKPCRPAGDAACKAWVAFVKTVRAFAGDKVLVSPRPSLLGVRALRAGIPIDDVAQALLFKLMAPDTVSRVKEACADVIQVLKGVQS
jgi:sigma54-dependent transcription regulator